MTVLEILLRGMAAGALLATGLGLLRRDRSNPARWTGAVFCLSVAAFAVHSGGAETQALGMLQPVVWLLSAPGTAFFWLFGITLFDDAPLRARRFLPALVLLVIAGIAAALSRAQADNVWIPHNLIEVGLVTHLFGHVWRHRQHDLVEARRAIRIPFLVLAGVLVALFSGVEIGADLGWQPDWLSFAQAGALALVSLLGAYVLLVADVVADAPASASSTSAHARDETASVRGDGEMGTDDDASPSAGDAPPGIAEARDRVHLAALRELMQREDAPWRREGLSIGQLAHTLGLPEHRLRRLINTGLGYRNFADFLNAHRIAAAQRALADPARARDAVSTIAFELGYASLAPFNRAFRQATGETPTAWRARTLSGPQAS